MPITKRRSRRYRATPLRAVGWRAKAAFVGILVAIGLIGIGGVLLLSDAETTPGGPVRIGGPFTLINGDGKQVTDGDFRGKFLLVYFGYTFCPDVCPTTLNEVSVAMQQLGPDAAKVQPIFVTVDPQRDTPEIVKQYAAAFDPRLIGLTGTPDQITHVAREYRVYYADHRAGPNARDYTVDHSSILYLVGPDGRFVASIRADEPGAAIAADIAKHLTSQVRLTQ